MSQQLLQIFQPGCGCSVVAVAASATFFIIAVFTNVNVKIVAVAAAAAASQQPKQVRCHFVIGFLVWRVVQHKNQIKLRNQLSWQVAATRRQWDFCSRRRRRGVPAAAAIQLLCRSAGPDCRLAFERHAFADGWATSAADALGSSGGRCPCLCRQLSLSSTSLEKPLQSVQLCWLHVLQERNGGQALEFRVQQTSGAHRQLVRRLRIRSSLDGEDLVRGAVDGAGSFYERRCFCEQPCSGWITSGRMDYKDGDWGGCLVFATRSDQRQ